jgi:hypothetical protein
LEARSLLHSAEAMDPGRGGSLEVDLMKTHWETETVSLRDAYSEPDSARYSAAKMSTAIVWSLARG